jgi:membrane protein implicated in regulation of membrane protease activity
VRLWGGFHLPSVGAAIGAVALVSELIDGSFAWLLVGLLATSIYLLVIAAQFTVADDRMR